MLEFPTVSHCNGQLSFQNGEIVPLPKEYLSISNKKQLEIFYKKIMETAEGSVICMSDPIGFTTVTYNNLIYVGLVIPKISGGDYNRLKKKYPKNRFEKDYIVERIKKESKLKSHAEYIPIRFVIQKFHEIRNLNAKISGNIDDIIGASTELEWEEKFDCSSQNVKKIYVASRLIKFILDNISFLSPNYFSTFKLNSERSSTVHRCLSKIVKIYTEDFKKNKALIEIEGVSYKRLAGDKEVFEVLLMILVENAIKYSNDASRIPPKVSIREVGYKLIITVSSFGLTIPANEQQNLFLRGYRSEVHKNIREGTGMGLHNAKELVNFFNSTLHYECHVINPPMGWNQFIISCNAVLS